MGPAIYGRGSEGSRQRPCRHCRQNRDFPAFPVVPAESVVWPSQVRPTASGATRPVFHVPSHSRMITTVINLRKPILTAAGRPPDNWRTAGHQGRRSLPLLADLGPPAHRQLRRTRMSFWTELRMPTERELLVGFYDLAGYMRHAEKTEPQELLSTMAGYFALSGQIVSDAGGRLIKTLGDAGLVAFPAEAADAGVLALRSVQSEGRTWLGQ